MVVKKFHNKDITYPDSSLTLNKSLYLSVILDFWWWKVFRNSISVCISPGFSGIICTNMFYMSVNKRLRGELVEAMVSYKLYISYVLAK